MKTMLIAGATAFILICGGLVFTSAAARTTPADKCLQFNQLNARATLTLVSSSLKPDGTWIVVEAGADKMRSSAVCSFNAAGEVDPLGTDIAWISSLQDNVIACLNRSNANWDAQQGKYKPKQEDCGEAAVSRRSGWLRLFNDGDLARAFGKK